LLTGGSTHPTALSTVGSGRTILAIRECITQTQVTIVDTVDQDTQNGRTTRSGEIRGIAIRSGAHAQIEIAIKGVIPERETHNGTHALARKAGSVETPKKGAHDGTRVLGRGAENARTPESVAGSGLKIIRTEVPHENGKRNAGAALIPTGIGTGLGRDSRI
jgi:hypothetical protein